MNWKERKKARKEEKERKQGRKKESKEERKKESKEGRKMEGNVLPSNCTVHMCSMDCDLCHKHVNIFTWVMYRRNVSTSAKRKTVYEGVSKNFRTESITKYTLTTINTR
jgi:hypothetical protein